MERQYSRGPYHDRYRFWCTSILFILGSRVRAFDSYLWLHIYPSILGRTLAYHPHLRHLPNWAQHI